MANAGAVALDYVGSASYFGVIAAARAATFVALAAVRHDVPRAAYRARRGSVRPPAAEE